MSVIGQQIKKYRTEKQITQEQLGEMLGVTTQAVSRWERGGTPDAEILPSLAKALGVSIDALFGQNEESLALSLARKISGMPRDQAYTYAFSLCWAIEVGLIGEPSAIDDFMPQLVSESVSPDDKKNDYFAKLICDSGIANARISPNLCTFFLMTEGSGSIKDQIGDIESLRKVFELFADEKLLKILFFLYSLPNMPVAADLIAANTGLAKSEAERCMDILCQNQLATHLAVATAEGEINSYIFRKESFLVPLLCIADEIARKDFRPFIGGFQRKKPFL